MREAATQILYTVRKFVVRWRWIGFCALVAGATATILSVSHWSLSFAGMQNHAWPLPLAGAILTLIAVLIVPALHRRIFVNGPVRRRPSMGMGRRRAPVIPTNAGMGIVTLDGNEVIEMVNPAIEAMYGNEANEMIGLHVRHLFSEMCDKAPGWRQNSILDAVDGAYETVAVRRSGKTFPVELIVSKAPLNSVQRVTLFVRDLSAYRQQQMALEHQAMHDDLTGLANRSLFFKRLRSTIEQSADQENAFSVLLLDLDRFKEVNDTLGHPIGDRLLQAIAKKLVALKPEIATLARFGGDEFGILLPDSGDDTVAVELSETIIETLCKPFELDGISLEVGASIGIARYPDHGTEASDLVQRADVAMYAAKQTQSGFAFYDAEEDRNSVRHLTLTGDLRRAVQENQLFLHFQPKIRMRGGKLIGVEALVRWNHPEHGFIPPDEFIDHAEQTGLTAPLTDWVLNAALRQWSTWQRQGLELDMAVNLSPRMLHFGDIVGMIGRRLEKWQMPAERLVIEITENALMIDPQRSSETVAALRKMGVRIAIDDFGTGYSSLSLLKELAAEELKIDKSFVMELTENENDRTIVESTIAMAHNLGLTVVAEGIESEDALVLLRRMGCDVGQGFHIGRPMAPADVDKWVSESAGQPVASRRQKRARKKPASKKRVAAIPAAAALI